MNLPSRSRTGTTSWVLGGVVAWIGLNGFVYALAPLMGIEIGGLASLAGTGLVTGTGATTLWTGRALLLGTALVWAALYQSVAGIFPGRPWVRGVLYGLVIWLFSAMALLPLAGWLSGLTAFGGPGWMGMAGLVYAGNAGAALSLGAHLVYGTLLAAITAKRANQTPGSV